MDNMPEAYQGLRPARRKPMGRPKEFLIEREAKRLGAEKLVNVEIKSIERFLKEHPEQLTKAKEMLAHRLLALADEAHAQAKATLKEESGSKAMIIAGLATQRALDLLGQTPQPTINLQVVIDRMQELKVIEADIKKLEHANGTD